MITAAVEAPEPEDEDLSDPNLADMVTEMARAFGVPTERVAAGIAEAVGLDHLGIWPEDHSTDAAWGRKAAEPEDTDPPEGDGTPEALRDSCPWCGSETPEVRNRLHEPNSPLCTHSFHLVVEK